MHTEVEPGSPVVPPRPSMASRVAFAALVGTFSLGGLASWRVALGGGLRDLSSLFEACWRSGQAARDVTADILQQRRRG